MATLQDFEERIAKENKELARLNELHRAAYSRKADLLKRYWHNKANLHEGDKVRLKHDVDGEEYGYEDSWDCVYETGNIGTIWMFEDIKGFSLEMLDDDGDTMGRIDLVTENDIEKV